MSPETLNQRWKKLADHHLLDDGQSERALRFAWRCVQFGHDHTKLLRQMEQALLKGDSAFFERLAEAMESKKLAYLPNDVTSTALLLFRELYRKLGHRPGRKRTQEGNRAENAKGNFRSPLCRAFHDDGLESLYS